MTTDLDAFTIFFVTSSIKDHGFVQECYEK